MTPERKFVVTEIKVYPSNEPDKARPVEVPPQTAKHDAIRRAQIAEDEKRGRREA